MLDNKGPTFQAVKEGDEKRPTKRNRSKEEEEEDGTVSRQTRMDGCSRGTMTDGGKLYLMYGEVVKKVRESIIY